MNSCIFLFLLCRQAGIPHMYTLESVRKGDEEDSDRRWKAEILEKERNPFVNLLLSKVLIPLLEVHTTL